MGALVTIMRPTRRDVAPDDPRRPTERRRLKGRDGKARQPLIESDPALAGGALLDDDAPQKIVVGARIDVEIAERGGDE